MSTGRGRVMVWSGRIPSYLTCALPHAGSGESVWVCLFECYKIEPMILLLGTKMPHNLKVFETMETFKEIRPAVAWSETSRKLSGIGICRILSERAGTKFRDQKFKSPTRKLGLVIFSWFLAYTSIRLGSSALKCISRLDVSTFTSRYTET